MIDWDSVLLGPVDGVFGEPASFTPITGLPFQASGVFDQAYREVDLAGGMAVTTESPVLGIRLSLCPMLPEQGWQVQVRGQAFTIREVQLDGHGWAKLLLNKVEL